MYLKGREESQSIRDAKAGNETKLTDHFPLLTVKFPLLGQTPNKAWTWVPGYSLGTSKANHSINYQKNKKLVTKVFSLKPEHTQKVMVALLWKKGTPDSCNVETLARQQQQQCLCPLGSCFWGRVTRVGNQSSACHLRGWGVASSKSM